MSASYCVVVLRAAAGADVLQRYQPTDCGPLVWKTDRAAAWTKMPSLTVQNTGCIIGRLFSRGAAPAPIHDLSDHQAARFASDPIDHLLKQYWGGYVAFFHGPRENTVVGFRDPSGTLPCWYSELHEAIIFSDDAATILELTGEAPEIAWEGIVWSLAIGDVSGGYTALMPLNELCSGQAIDVAPEGSDRHDRWEPWNYINDSRQGLTATAAQLRETADGCVGAWASCFKHVLLGVSGGLDSSIVAAITNTRAERLSTFTMVGDDADSDERRYARMLTAGLGVSLYEGRYGLEMIDIAKPIAPTLPYPVGRQFMQATAATRTRLHEELGVDAYFSGNAGDAVLGYMRSAAPLADRLKSEGVGIGLVQTLRDIQQLTGASVWEIGREAWKHFRQGGHRLPGIDRTLLGSMAISILNEDPPEERWFGNATRTTSPGEAKRVEMILKSLNPRDGYPPMGEPLVLTPLQSQPIVEFCLSVPTWMLIDGGVDRAVARIAYRDSLPEAIATRRSKGGPTVFEFQIYQSNHRELRERLLDGRLAAAMMIDRSALELLFSKGELISLREAARILELAAIEAWLDHWAK